MYLITGNVEKLAKMLKIAEMRGDVMGRFHNALYLGDVQERVAILEECNHLPLAYATAKVHGLTEAAEELERQLGDNIPSLPDEEKSALLMPPRPILQENNWPLLVVSKGLFEGIFTETVGAADTDGDDGAAGAWGAEIDIVEPEGLDGETVIVVPEEDRGVYHVKMTFCLLYLCTTLRKFLETFFVLFLLLTMVTSLTSLCC